MRQWIPKALCLAAVVAVAHANRCCDSDSTGASKPITPEPKHGEFRGGPPEAVSYAHGSNPANDFGEPE